MRFRVLVVALLLASSAAPAWAQHKPLVAARNDPCAPIGKTARGELIYSMKCERPPMPVAPPQAAVTPPAASVAAPVAEEDKGGLFRNPFPNLVRSSGSDDRDAGVGPSVGGR